MPTAPSGVPPGIVDISGTWVGTLESELGVQQITLTVVQASNCVDGTWRSTSTDWRGAISGFAEKDSYAGLVSLEKGPCLGVVDMAGPVVDGTLKWTGGPVKPSAGSGVCADPLPQTITLTLSRQ